MEENKTTIVTSYRLKEETKEKLKLQLEQMGLTQEQYFNKIVNLMELENVKQNNIFAVNAVEIQDLTQRLYNIFINLCDQGNSFLSNKDLELQELKEKYKNMLENKENVIQSKVEELQRVYDINNVLQNENEEHRIELIKAKNDYIKQLEQLESSLQDKSSLVEEYKGKNDMLLTQLKTFEKCSDQLETTKEILIEVQDQNKTLNYGIKEKDNIIEKLNENIEELKDKHKKETEQLQQIKDLEKDKAILDLQKQYQQYQQEQQNKHNVEIAEYQSKYKILLEEIEKGKNKTTVAAKSKAVKQDKE